MLIDMFKDYLKRARSEGTGGASCDEDGLGS